MCQVSTSADDSCEKPIHIRRFWVGWGGHQGIGRYCATVLELDDLQLREVEELDLGKQSDHGSFMPKRVARELYSRYVVSMALA